MSTSLHCPDSLLHRSTLVLFIFLLITFFGTPCEPLCFHNVFKHLNTSPYVLQCFLVTYTSTLSQEAFFNNVLFHELSHSLGPAFVGNDEANGEVVSWLSIPWRTRNVLSVSSKQEGIRWKIIRCGLRWVPHTVGSRKVEQYFFFSEENLVMHFMLLSVVNRHGVKDRRVRGGDYLSIQTPKTVKVNSLYKMPATKGAGVKIFSTFILTRRVHQMVTFPFEGYKKNVTGNIVQLLKTCLLLRIGVLLHPLPAVDHSPSPFFSSQVIL